MTMPKTVKEAVIAVWITLAISALVAVINKRIGAISDDKFMLSLICYGICCIFPYKLSKGSNPTRYIYAILNAIACLTMFGGITGSMPKLDIIVSVILIPVECFIIWRLFTGEAKDWFENKKPPALPDPQ